MSSNCHESPARIEEAPSQTGLTKRTGVLLLNLGTPDEPTTSAVRRYLRQFLSDPRVIDINPVARALILNLFILPFRPARSAEAYHKIWTEKGSPILLHGRELTRLVKAVLRQKQPDRYDVRLAMRYGNPSIEAVLRGFQRDGIDEVLAVPLYPQYASATVGSTLEEVYRCASLLWNTPYISCLPVFWDDEQFIEAWRQVTVESIDLDSYDHALFSFHGLPERHIHKSDNAGKPFCKLNNDCCATIAPENRYCYRAHCYQTAKRIAESLNLPADKWTLSFQSRLGRDPWLRPYTDELIRAFPSKGVKRLAVFSPAFVADCLETLEELGMQAVESFQAAGGEECTLVPSLNTHSVWVKALSDMILRKTTGDRE